MFCLENLVHGSSTASPLSLELWSELPFCPHRIRVRPQRDADCPAPKRARGSGWQFVGRVIRYLPHPGGRRDRNATSNLLPDCGKHVCLSIKAFIGANLRTPYAPTPAPCPTRWWTRRPGSWSCASSSLPVKRTTGRLPDPRVPRATTPTLVTVFPPEPSTIATMRRLSACETHWAKFEIILRAAPKSK